MTPGREYRDYLQDIPDAVEKAESFTRGMDFDAFAGDDKTVFAVIRALEVIGEASKSIPAPVRSRYDSVPWRDMAGMRDKLIHDYFGVDLKAVWKALREDFPAIKPHIVRAVKEACGGGEARY